MTLFRITLASAGVVNLLPILGLFGTKQLEKLYGIPFGETNLLILMRHRAVQFGLTGTFMITAALWRPQWQVPAVATGLTSMLSFAALAFSSSKGFNEKIRRVVVVDLVASSALIIAIALDYKFM